MDILLPSSTGIWRTRAYWEGVAVGVLLLAASLVTTLLALVFLERGIIHMVSSPDFFLDILPVTSMEGVLVWGVPILLAFTVIAVLRHTERLPLLLQSTGLLFLVRSFFVILTPMGVRPDQAVTSAEGLLQTLAYGSNDFFFSGHTGFPLMLALVFWNDRLMRNIFLGFTALFGTGVLLAHTHYSIDVFSVPFIVPTVYRFARLWHDGHSGTEEPVSRGLLPSFSS